MRTLMMALALAVLATGLVGCSGAAGHSVSMNMKYMCDDTQRMLGLDMPSQLHPRDGISSSTADPYIGIE